jgi:GPH family glycoside/pentoside/hexuronide:cation symporter
LKQTLNKTLVDEPQELLPLSTIWIYTVPRIATGVMALLFGVYLMKFATDVLLIAPAVMGTLIAASRIWDGFSDPMVGYLSDRTRSPHGRRRSWLFYSAVPMGIGLFMIWSPPSMLTGTMIILWMALALLVYETASTAFYIPHGALGVELTPNYHERTKLFGYSHMFTAIGSILGLAALYFMGEAEDKRTFAFYLSAVAGVLVAGLILWSTQRMPERRDYQGRGPDSVFKSIVDVFKNPHALLLLIVYGIETFGAAVIGVLVPYLVEYVIPMDQLPISGSAFMVSILLVYTVPQFVFTPVWIRLSKRFGKKKLWVAAMWLSSATFLGYFFAIDNINLIWILAFCQGLASGCGLVVAPAIKADIIDYDEYRTHERKEGAYLAVWNLVRKTSAAITALIVGWVLQFSGFEPNVEQSEDAKFALRALFSLLPFCCYFIGALLFMRFQFNEAEHGEIRQVLAQRKLMTMESEPK